MSFLRTLLVFGALLALSTVVGSSQVNLSKHPVIVIISYDGFRYDYLEKTETPNLHRVKNEGVSVPYMLNQFLTNTFPNHHSIATGLYIDAHGIVGNTLYDPLYGKFLSGYNDDPGFWNYSSSILPLWVVNELAGDERVSGAMMWPGSNEPFGENKTYATYRRKYNGSYPYEDRIDDVISWITDDAKPANLVFLYFDEPDSTGHDDGPEGDAMIRQIQRMDNLTGYFLDKLEELEILDRVNLIFLSDHGMMELSDEKEIDLEGISDATKFSQYGSSPVLQLLPHNENDTLSIYEDFKRAAAVNGNFDVYLKNDTTILKPEWHYVDSRRILPILVVAQLGYMFKVTNDNGYVMHGQHGFDSANPEMHPYFLARGPMFKKNAVAEPFENIDIYPLVSEILHIVPPPNNGSLNNVLSLLSLSRTSTATDGSGPRSVGKIVGAIAGCVGLIAIVGLLVFLKRRRKHRSSMEVIWNG